MLDADNFFEFIPNMFFAEYIKFYTQQEDSAYECFSKAKGGMIPQHAIDMINNDLSPQTSIIVCQILDEAIFENGERETQFNNFKLFLQYFDKLSDEFYDAREADEIFLANGHNVISYEQLYNTYSNFIQPYIKFVAEIGLDMWNNIFGVNGHNSNGMYNISDDIYDIISFSEYTPFYKRLIFEAADRNDEYIIHVLVNVFFHAFNLAKQVYDEPYLHLDGMDDEVMDEVMDEDAMDTSVDYFEYQHKDFDIWYTYREPLCDFDSNDE